MKSFKKLLILALVVVFSLINVSKANETEKSESKKNFLKSNVEVKKVLKTKTDSSIQANIQLSTTATTEMPLIANRNLQTDQSEEEQYELQRANAMAEFIF